MREEQQLRQTVNNEGSAVVTTPGWVLPKFAASSFEQQGEMPRCHHPAWATTARFSPEHTWRRTGSNKRSSRTSHSLKAARNLWQTWQNRRQEGCFRCSLLSLRVAALEQAPHYSSCLTASKAASRELIFTHIYWIFAQPSPSPHLARRCGAGSFAPRGCSGPHRARLGRGGSLAAPPTSPFPPSFSSRG